MSLASVARCAKQLRAGWSRRTPAYLTRRRATLRGQRYEVRVLIALATIARNHVRLIFCDRPIPAIPMVVVFGHRAPGASTPTACAVSNANDARAATTAKMRVIVTLCFFVLLPVLRTFVELERCVETSMNDPAKLNRIVEQANLLRGAYYARSGSLSSLAFVHRYIEVRAD